MNLPESRSEKHFAIFNFANGIGTGSRITSILCVATTDFSVVRDQLPCRRERATSEDPFAVALMKGEMIVGHARDLAVASSRRRGVLCSCLLTSWL